MRFLSSDQLSEGMVTSKNIYDASLTLLLRSGNTLSQRYIQRINDLGYRGIYISDNLSEDIQIEDIVIDELRVEAFLAVKDTCYHAYHYAKNSNKYAEGVNKHFQNTFNVASKLIVDLKKRNIGRINLIDLKVFEDYIVSHNVNVGVLSLFLGIEIGLSTVELQRLGVAALLHDVGKMFLDPKILNKTGKLTEEEHKQINMHSSYSYRYAKECYHIHPSTYLGILYHHERIDGTGYPKGKSGKDIPLFSRIIAICDVYDALTSNRPNRPPLLPSEAIEYMMASGNSAFDMELLKVFTKKIAPFPKGVEVRLSNGETGIVTDNIDDLLLRPILRVFKDSEGHLIEPKMIHLSSDTNYRNVTIIEVLHTKLHF
jgi:HD-GYP domain-containing protein (c-di-GMP phosphodiesterase class II)